LNERLSLERHLPCRRGGHEGAHGVSKSSAMRDARPPERADPVRLRSAPGRSPGGGSGRTLEFCGQKGQQTVAVVGVGRPEPPSPCFSCRRKAAEKARGGYGISSRRPIASRRRVTRMLMPLTAGSSPGCSTGRSARRPEPLITWSASTAPYGSGSPAWYDRRCPFRKNWLITSAPSVTSSATIT
jgi:hypothetical protein